MSKIEKDDLGYLGRDFQYRLILQIIVDRKFGESIIEILSPNYFEDMFLRSLAGKIKDNYEKYEVIPDMNSLQTILVEDITDDINKKMFLDNLQKVKDADMHNGLRTQDTGMKFCKQQELKKSLREIQGIIDRGNLEDYPLCEEIIKKALSVGDNKDDGIDVFNDLDNVMSDDFRQPIATGIEGLDAYMDGGLSKGELAVILAPYGVGKTTMITKIANHAKNLGNNVLQIFFEDNPKIIQRKHLTCWMEGEISLNELNDNRESVMERARERESQPGSIKLKKFPSDGTTIPQIKNYIRRLTAQGWKPDIVLLDYIDCVQPTRQFKDEWTGEGQVMRQFETMLDELDIAGWTAVQGNRSSIKAEIVEADQMGGSIKKGQIGHFIVSIAKSLIQKENGTANMAILKSRFGKDGIIFEDVVFDNGTIMISMTKDNERGKSFLQTQESKQAHDQLRVNNVLDAIDRRRRELANNEE
mgnify:CR=1 FL=1